MVSVSEYASLADVDRTVWNSLIPPGSCSARWEYLYAAEQHSGTAFESFRYYLFREHETIAGVAVAYCMTIPFANFLPLSWQRVVKRLGRLQQFRVVLCGTIASDGLPGVFLASERSGTAILELLDSRLKGFARESRALGVVYKEFSDSHEAVMKGLEAKGYVRTASFPSYSLPVRWEDLDAYGAALNRKYRQALTKTRGKMNSPSLHCVLISDPSQVPRELYGLYRHVHDKAQYKLETVEPGFFPELLRRYEDKSALLLFVLDGKPVGFIVLIEDESCLQGVYLGYDPEHNERFDLYFNLVYQSLDFAMRRKKKTFILGQTADAFKLRVGCTPEGRWFLFSLNNPIVHAVFKKLAPILFSSDEYPVRNVFKASSS